MDQDSMPVAAGSLAQPYDFHDEKFVTWWLNSLYLFSTQDQLAIAQLLRDAIHAPDAAREIEAFVTIRAQGIGEMDSLSNQPMRHTGTAGSRDGGVFRSMVQLWRAGPWTATLGLGALAFFLAKGLWFVLREGYRLIF
jgi:hypothetical protein